MNPEIIKIGTHDGRFHADEVLAVRLLRFVLDKPCEVTRTRNKDLLSTMDFVVDVGGVYDPQSNLFDHHQTSCNETFKWKHYTSDIPLSSAGLVYQKYCKQIVTMFIDDKMIDDKKIYKVISTNEELIDSVIIGVYKIFIREIDANDNGIPVFKKHHEPTYDMHNYQKNVNIINTVRHMNGQDVENYQLQMENFESAMKYMWWTLHVYMKSIINEEYNLIIDSEKMTKFYNNREIPSILVMTEECTTWRKQLRQLDLEKEVKFVIYPKKYEDPNNKLVVTEWGFGTVQRKSFENEIDLLTKEELPPDVAKDVVFVHKNRFCGSSSSYDNAMNVCKLSIEQYVKMEQTFETKKRYVICACCCVIIGLVSVLYMK
jgi:uncharacterized UPF0160 family protein